MSYLEEIIEVYYESFILIRLNANLPASMRRVLLVTNLKPRFMCNFMLDIYIYYIERQFPKILQLKNALACVYSQSHRSNHSKLILVK